MIAAYIGIVVYSRLSAFSMYRSKSVVDMFAVFIVQYM